MARNNALARANNALAASRSSGNKARKKAKNAPMKAAVTGSAAMLAGAAAHGFAAAKGFDAIGDMPAAPVIAAVGVTAGFFMKSPELIFGSAGYLAPYVSKYIEDMSSGVPTAVLAS
jgi:hypothetical protein